MEKKSRAVLLLVTIILIIITGVLVIRSEKKNKETMQEDFTEYEEEGILTHNGEKYKYNSSLRTILFMGIDKAEEMTEQTIGNGGQSDSLLLAILDSDKKTYQILTISRDSMIDIQAYDIHGNKLGMEYAQLALQYAYGDGAKRSCWLTKEAVSRLLYEIPIHSYVALTMEGFSVLTDQMGGVELTVPEDYTYLEPQFEKGKTIQMDGKMAEHYVRMRDKTVVGSNSKRMERQEQFLTAMVQKMQKKLQEEPDFFTKIQEVMKPYMQTDITVNEIKKLARYESLGEILTVPGEVRRGKEHDEFLVDNEKLKELILELFYRPKK